MLPRTSRRYLFGLLLLALTALVVLAACDEDKETTGPTSTPQATRAATQPGATAPAIDISGVPELADGTLTIGSDIAYAPIEFYEEGTQNATGLDIDIMTAMAGALGVDVEFEQVADFAGIVGDLQAQRYDVVMSAISITPEREAEIDLIPYFGPVGTGILVPSGNPQSIAGPEDLCGLRVAAQVGTIQVDQVDALNQSTCSGNEIAITAFPDNPTAVQELILGRVDAELADDPVAQYSALQSDGALEVAVTQFPDAAAYGIGVRKESTQLRAVLEQALQAIIDDGTYAEILQEWGQEDFGIE